MFHLPGYVNAKDLWLYLLSLFVLTLQRPMPGWLEAALLTFNCISPHFIQPYQAFWPSSLTEWPQKVFRLIYSCDSHLGLARFPLLWATFFQSVASNPDLAFVTSASNPPVCPKCRWLVFPSNVEWGVGWVRGGALSYAGLWKWSWAFRWAIPRRTKKKPSAFTYQNEWMDMMCNYCLTLK